MTTSEAWKRFALHAETLARTASKGACVTFSNNAIVQTATTQQKFNKEEKRRSYNMYFFLYSVRGGGGLGRGAGGSGRPPCSMERGGGGLGRGAGGLGRPPCSRDVTRKNKGEGCAGPTPLFFPRHVHSSHDARYLS